jgi:bud site selection protein 20
MSHRRGKPHKRRVKAIREGPWSQKEADAAVGLATDNGEAGRGLEPTVEVDMTI